MSPPTAIPPPRFRQSTSHISLSPRLNAHTLGQRQNVVTLALDADQLNVEHERRVGRDGPSAALAVACGARTVRTDVQERRQVMWDR